MKKLTMLKKVTIAVAAVFMSMSMTACVGGGAGNVKIDGITGPDVEFTGGNVILSMVFNNVQIDGGAVIPIPKYPHSSLQVSPDFMSSGTLLVLTINAADFIGANGKFFNPTQLPDGRPLPAVASGNLPAVAVQIPQLFNTVLYVGPSVIGFFVPFKLSIAGDAIVTFRFSNKEGKNIGILALVGAQSQGLMSGVLALMNSNLLGIISK